MTTLADALQGGGQYIKWDEVGQGTVVGGRVTAVTMRQARKFESTDLAFWDDGTPQMQAVIEVQTDERRDADDDGRRSITINLWSGQKRALADACRAAGVAEPTPGDDFRAVWTSGVGKAKDPRVFSYKITQGSGLGSELLGTAAADPFATQAAPAAPAAPVAAPAAPAAPVAPPNPIEAAKALLRAGMSQTEAAAATGYSPEIVAALAGQL